MAPKPVIGAQRPAWIEAQVQQGPVEAIDMPWPADCGAECVFLGRTREEEHETYGRLIELEYECYPAMAQKLLREMAEHVVHDFDCHAVRIVHSAGIVPPGRSSVVIQVATPHRGESFEACRYLIDRLKHELPVWKSELWQKGRTWVEGCCAHHPSDRRETPPPRG